jgi:hypothetical protein
MQMQMQCEAPMSTYVLRPYQNESVEAGVAFMEKPGAENGIIVLPCGAGIKVEASDGLGYKSSGLLDRLEKRA